MTSLSDRESIITSLGERAMVDGEAVVHVNSTWHDHRGLVD